MTPFLSTKPDGSWRWRGWGHFRGHFRCRLTQCKKQKKHKWSTEHLPKCQNETTSTLHYFQNTMMVIRTRCWSSPKCPHPILYPSKPKKKVNKSGVKTFISNSPLKNILWRKYCRPVFMCVIKKQCLKRWSKIRWEIQLLSRFNKKKKTERNTSKTISANLCFEGAQNDHRDPSQVY